jgi:hypothetical protein
VTTAFVEPEGLLEIAREQLPKSPHHDQPSAVRARSTLAARKKARQRQRTSA